MYPLDDTIVAVASPPGGAARGIVRLSGPAIFECLASVGAAVELPPHPSSSPRVIAASLELPELFSPLPCDVYCWPSRGYTGQPCAEIHTLGSPPLLQIVVRALCAAGARAANRGEFTLRAFLAGRIDLTQAEAVLGVIDADSGPSLAVALSQLAGGLARPLHRLRDELIDLLAHVEAGFDFADEDLPFITREELALQLAEAQSGVAALLQQMVSRSESSDSVRAVLIGRPNAGKSSLFNAIVGRSAAIVSHQPGTTRDYLTAELNLDGARLRLIDTAGIGSPSSESCNEGEIDRAARSAAETQHRTADLRVLCLDSTRPMDDWERRALREETDKNPERSIVVLTKCDRRSPPSCSGRACPPCLPIDTAGKPARYTSVTNALDNAIETSSLTGAGIETLRGELRQKTLDAAGVSGNVVAGTAARCRESLRLAGESLHRASEVAADGCEELAAAEIRVALDELGRVTGAVYADDVLDRIFSRFCVGK